MDTKIVAGLAGAAIVLAGISMAMTWPAVKALESRVADAEAKVETLSAAVDAGKAARAALAAKLTAQLGALDLYAGNKASSGSSASPDSASAADALVKAARPENPRIVEKFPLRFELKDCNRQRTATTVKCRVLLTDLTDELLQVNVHALQSTPTILVDEDGNVYQPNGVSFLGIQHDNYLRGDLAPGVSPAAVFEYEDVSSNAKFGSLQITVDDETNNDTITVSVGPVAIAG